MSSFKHLLAWDYASHWRKAIVWVEEERVAPFSACFLLFGIVLFAFSPLWESGPSLNICRISDLPHYDDTIPRFYNCYADIFIIQSTRYYSIHYERKNIVMKYFLGWFKT